MAMGIQAALDLAVRAHADQWREGDSPLPYVTHPIEVMTNLRYVGLVTDEEMLCAALLHDTVEETSVTLPDIAKTFGPRVGALVKELTRREPSPAQIEGMTKGEIWSLRSDMLLKEISKMSPDAQQIKLADRLSNLRDAYRTKQGEKLVRYGKQSSRILKIVPRERNPGLWDAIRALL